MLGVALTGITFVVLKLCHVIDWSWWWVTLPFWAVPALFLFFMANRTADRLHGSVYRMIAIEPAPETTESG
jgi:hypothetical protein